MPPSHRVEVRLLLSQVHFRHVDLFQIDLDPTEYHFLETPVVMERSQPCSTSTKPQGAEVS